MSRPLAVGAALFVATFAVLLATERPVGFARDESTYFAAGEDYARWYRLLLERPAYALRDETIAAAFGGFEHNFEHPVLLKSAFGLSEALFADTLGWLRPATAARLPALALAALIPVLLFAFGRRLGSPAVGLFAACSFFLVPRQFFHAHLACFDLPIAAMWLLVVYAFLRAQAERGWWLWTGVCFGLALATKHNAFFLPVVLAPFALVRAFQLSRHEPAVRRTVLAFVGVHLAVALLYGLLFAIEGQAGFVARFDLLSPQTLLWVLLLAASALLLLGLRRTSEPVFRALAPLTAITLFGPVLFYLHWPWLWHHPVERTAGYLAFHAQHNHYAWFYLGTMLREPPFPLLYVVVKTALTVPLALLAPMAFGLVALIARTVGLGTRRPTFPELLVGANAVFSIALISHPDVPHFGGVKHWFPSMPFLALLAGQSVVRASEAIAARGRRLRPEAVQLGFSALLFASPLVATARVFPYGTSAYAELAGGIPGAASLGMQRQFWSTNVTGVLPWLNANASEGARLWLHEVTDRSFFDYQRNGMLRRDLRVAHSAEEADLAVYQYHQEFREQEFDIWQAFGTQSPVTGLYVDETPQIVVYRRP